MEKAEPIIDDPAGYYMNIHSAEHPNGAVRGQLAASPQAEAIRQELDKPG